MKKFGSGYHGGDGKIGYFELKGFSTVDIDNEEDFQLAELVSKSIQNDKNSLQDSKKLYKERSEVFVPDILRKDGVVNNEFNQENLSVSNIDDIISKNDNKISWSHRLINTENNSATLISQIPGEGNRKALSS